MSQEARELSSALLAAQQRLIRLREERQSQPLSPGLPVSKKPGALFAQCQEAPSPDLSRVRLGLPAHLGWESDSFTDLLRRRTGQPLPYSAVMAQGESRSLGEPAAAHVPSQTPAAPSPAAAVLIKLYPDVALGMLRQEQTAAGRIWLLLRYLDREGCGWICLDHARAHLTEKDSPLRVCGWRQLRNLLAQGDDLFWCRTNERVWIRSLARVAASLGVRKLTGWPVAVPLSVLLGGIGTLRAHFYASFHSGRPASYRSGSSAAMPIARATLRRVCGISRRTQRSYEKRAEVGCQRNFAVGQELSTADEHLSAWKQGEALFHLADEKGKQGEVGRVYLAWQLPNNYVGPHSTQSRGRQKRINQDLADLFNKGMTGNGKATIDAGHPRTKRRFFDSVGLAATAYRKQTRSDVYWRSRGGYSRGQRFRMWHYLPGRSTAIHQD